MSRRSSSQGRFKVISTRVYKDMVVRWTGHLVRQVDKGMTFNLGLLRFLLRRGNTLYPFSLLTIA